MLLRFLALIMAIFSLFACGDDDSTIAMETNTEPPDSTQMDSIILSPFVQQLLDTYTPIPERAVSISKDGRVHALYTDPVDRYQHGILGDVLEGSQLVVAIDSNIIELTLTAEYVFEDIRPRLFDVDRDGALEVICIRAKVRAGAGIVIYKVENQQLIEYAFVEEIGRENRWLNIATIADLDGDGGIEIAWIQTPHIGGILKVAKIKAGQLEVLDQKSQYSNHAIGSRNLCLSVLVEKDSRKVLYVPTQNRRQISGFYFENEQWQELETINLAVDFEQVLKEQYSFEQIIDEENNCIN